MPNVRRASITIWASFSAGVADSRTAGASAQAMLKRADDELLQAKREGRNRVRVASALTPV